MYNTTVISNKHLYVNILQLYVFIQWQDNIWAFPLALFGQHKVTLHYVTAASYLHISSHPLAVWDSSLLTVRAPFQRRQRSCTRGKVVACL